MFNLLVFFSDQSEKVPLTSFVFGTASLAISAVLFLALMYWCFYTGDADWYPTSCWKAGIVSFALIGKLKEFEIYLEWLLILQGV